MVEKLFYSMGEVAELFDVNSSLLRYWEMQFNALDPKRNGKGDRVYTPEDIKVIKQIYHLVKERGLTLGGARKVLKSSMKEHVLERDVELLERLQRVRAMLMEVREELTHRDGDVVCSSVVRTPIGSAGGSVELEIINEHSDDVSPL